MKKKIKVQSKLFKQEVTLIIDDRLSNLPVSEFAARKLKLANEHLKTMKGLPKV